MSLPVPSSGSLIVGGRAVFTKSGTWTPATNTNSPTTPEATNTEIVDRTKIFNNALTIAARRATDTICGDLSHRIYAPPGTYKIELYTAYDEILFNGSDLISMYTADFPTGFLATNVKVNGRFEAQTSFGSAMRLSSLDLLFSGASYLTLVEPDFDNINAPTDPATTSNNVFGVGIATGAITVFSAAFGFQGIVDQILVPCDVSPLTGGIEFRVDYLYLTADYIIWSASLAVAQDPVDERVITVTDGNNGLDQIDSLTVEYLSGGVVTSIPVTNIISRTPGSIVFNLPAGTPVGISTPLIIGGVGDGTQFSGTINLGLITILLADASGIYELQWGKTNDTLYDRSDPGATIDVKIPNPFLKTGFLP